MTASFEVNYVARHVPPALWRVFAAVVHDGPALANDRLRRIIHQESRRTIKQNRSDREAVATIAESSLRTAVTQFRRLYLRALVPMHQEGYPSALLDPWTHTPPPLKIEASSWKADRSAPGRPLLRLAWQQTDREVKTRIAAALRGPHEMGPDIDIDDVDALQILRCLPQSRLNSASVFRASRNRALLACFVALGGRRGALMDLDRRDYKHDFRDPDGRLTAAIALRPSKHARRDHISWKPIPAAMARALDLYLLVVERILGAPLPAFGPLFIPSPRNADRHMTGTAVVNIMGGAASMKPLLPKPQLMELTSAEQTASCPRTPGYSPQSLRRAALQLVRQGARSYCDDNAVEADPACLAEVLLDHKKISADTMGYADINTVDGRIRWSQIAIAISWEMLTTDRGARRVPDVRRFKEALDLETALRAELKRAEREVEQLFDARFAAASSELVVELMVAFHRVREIERSLADVKEVITALEHDRDSWLVLPDDAPDEWVDLKAIRRGGTGRPRQTAADRARWFFTVTEWAEFAGSLATARRQAGGRMPHRGVDPRNPWQPGDGTVDDSLGHRKRRIDVDMINPGYFDTSAKRARRDEILATMPRGFTRQECAPRSGSKSNSERKQDTVRL